MLLRALRRVLLPLAVLGLLSSTIAKDASAFCGFYVGGAGQELYNNASQVVLMRDGLRTVLSMSNNYQGPPTGFAMVVPVPIVLQKENVKTLPKEVFDRIDKLDAPRLVEYWEQDPCHPYQEEERLMASPPAPMMESGGGGSKRDYGVKVEAKFSVGEYDIVILSAKDSNGLEGWLTAEKYAIPAGSEPYLRPYVQRGSKFFVAKVDPKRVTFVPNPNGGGAPMATLSPLRFHYDSEQFALPVRLGLVNSKDAQDLIVHILAKDTRYEVANYPNVIIPTNIDVNESTATQFGPFYAALFDRTLERNPKAIVTEYAWQAGSCDPCPIPPLDMDALAAFGADVIPSTKSKEDPSALPMAFVLTRLHARYTKESLGADLVFRNAAAIQGGRENWVPRNEQAPFDEKNRMLERGGVASDMNNFQARYIIRHPWTGPITCEKPVRGIWGGPPDQQGVGGGRGGGARNPATQPAQNLAFVARGKAQLGTFLREDNSDLDVKASPPSQGDPPLGVVVPPPAHTCGCNVVPLERGLASFGALTIPAIAFLVRRHRHRHRRRPN